MGLPMGGGRVVMEGLLEQECSLDDVRVVLSFPGVMVVPWGVSCEWFW